MELTGKQKAAFGIGAVGKDMVYALSASYVMYYYQDVLHLSATFVGLILMIARIFDAFNDPLMGILVAKTRTRFGRFRPWIFTGTVLNAFVLYALFAAPVLSEAGMMVYFSVAYILWGVTYTMMDIPYWSMIPAVTKTPKDRETLSVVGPDLRRGRFRPHCHVHHAAGGCAGRQQRADGLPVCGPDRFRYFCGDGDHLLRQREGKRPHGNENSHREGDVLRPAPQRPGYGGGRNHRAHQFGPVPDLQFHHLLF